MNIWLKLIFAAAATLFAYLISLRSRLPQAPVASTAIYWMQKTFYPKDITGAARLFLIMLLSCMVLWTLFSSYMAGYDNMLISTGLGLLVILLLCRLVVKRRLKK